jgi:hypothetical protein
MSCQSSYRSSLRPLRLHKEAVSARPTSEPLGLIYCVQTDVLTEVVKSSFSTCAVFRDASLEAESSTAPHHNHDIPELTTEEAFKRNLKEIQAFRRRRDALRMSPMFNFYLRGD